MAKKADTGVVAEIKKLLEGDKLVFGVEETVKGLRAGQIKKVFVSANVGPQSMLDLERYCGINGVDLVELAQSSEETGTFCKKPFAVSVIGVLA